MLLYKGQKTHILHCVVTLALSTHQRLINSALSDPPEVDIFAMRDVVSLATAIQRISALVDEEEVSKVLCT